MNAQQKKVLSVLNAFADICKEHGLRYYLLGGTLLGAVRHHGFIPWDDDVDVGMPETDYQKFLRLSTVLPEHLALETSKSREDYPYYFCKLCDKTTPFQTQYAGKPCGVFVDVFPLNPARKPNLIVQTLYNLQHIAVYVLQVKYNWQKFVPYKLWYAQVAYSVLSQLPPKTLKQIRDRILGYLRKEKTGYLFSPGGAYKADKEFFPEAWFEGNEQLIFEGRFFPVPVEWDKILTQFYGEYMRIPDEEHRKAHNV